MSRRLATRAGRLAVGVLAAAAAGFSLLTAPAQAAPDAAVRPYGTVSARTGVNERTQPSTDATVRGILRHRIQIGLRCKVRAQDIAGNNVWYMLRDRQTWVAAKYIENAGDIPYCRMLNRSAVDDSAESRNAMG
ncbi:SH3 domain-containing protein [Streptomyces sp. I05A-00742]|uniref:SH3 domain-containing protein n=1 Tax=Streptomyces sp. I05A-00742 TaxID=2732853 RepID=UPI002016A9DD|nr:SH3 domain-containing protein [Streptomyces sp. I05A-00742]